MSNRNRRKRSIHVRRVLLCILGVLTLLLLWSHFEPVSSIEGIEVEVISTPNKRVSSGDTERSSPDRLPDIASPTQAEDPPKKIKPSQPVEPLKDLQTRLVVALPRDWQETFLATTWVAYAPSNFDPHRGFRPSASSLEQDLLVLRAAGFDGLVTYGMDIWPDDLDISTVMDVVDNIGLKVILGVWNPLDENELRLAIQAARHSAVVGVVIGNEGLISRYSFEELRRAVLFMKSETGKPVTTTEQIEDYLDPSVLALGDWVFPNAHPFWHEKKNVVNAVRWTQEQYTWLGSKTDRLVIFKEVGLPSEGLKGMSETAQAHYYEALARTPVHFVWFEAFDQPWKAEGRTAVEAHWGLFRSNRTPKEVARRLMESSEEQ